MCLDLAESAAAAGRAATPTVVELLRLGRRWIVSKDAETDLRLDRAREKLFHQTAVAVLQGLGAYQEPSENVTRERIAEIYSIFPRLAERRSQLAGTMSGGEQAMVSIGRGLMRAPKLLLIDEPSLGLSPRLVQENFRIIKEINARGITVFLVEQNVHQTLAIAHYGYVLSKGRVVAEGSPQELADRDEVREAYFG